MAFGRLERTTGAEPMNQINMTPLIDVMLVLLVIFMVTAPLMVQGIGVNLPQAEGTRSVEAPRPIVISVDRSGTIWLDQKTIALNALRSTLRDTAQTRPDAEIQLHADTAVAYGAVMAVMGAAQDAGLTRISFVATPEKP